MYKIIKIRPTTGIFFAGLLLLSFSVYAVGRPFPNLEEQVWGRVYAEEQPFRTLEEQVMLIRYQGGTPLHVAALLGQALEIQKLIKDGASPQDTTCEGYTPLHCAASNCHKEAVEVLLRQGARPDAQAKDGSTPLHLAVKSTACYIKKHQLEIIESLIDYGAQVNARDYCGLTPLHCAASHWNVLAVDTLLLYDKSQVNALSTDGSTPLHLAASAPQCSTCTRDLIEVIETLLGYNAQVNARNDRGQTPLHCAAGEGHGEVIKILLQMERVGRNNLTCEEDKACKIDARDENGLTPLHYATRAGHIEALEILIERGAAIDARDNNGYTPLHYAASFGEIDAVAALVKGGAETFPLSDGARTPLTLAAKASATAFNSPNYLKYWAIIRFFLRADSYKDSYMLSTDKWGGRALDYITQAILEDDYVGDMRSKVRDYFQRRNLYVKNECSDTDDLDALFAVAAYFLDIPVLEIIKNECSSQLKTWCDKDGRNLLTVAREMHDTTGAQWLIDNGIFTNNSR